MKLTDEYDLNEIERRREKGVKKRKRKKKTKGFFKGLLIFLGIIILALTAFVVTVKIAAPDFDFSALVPKQVVDLVKEDVLGETTTAAPTTTTTTTTATQTVDYLEFDNFEFDTSKQGNSLGNLMGKGKGAVAYDSSYIYHLVKGKGIYRFGPESESYTRVYKSDSELSSLNLRGDYFYFINEDNGKAYKMKKGGSDPKPIAANVKFLYVYASNVYYITKDNSLCIMDVKELQSKTLYTADADLMLDFVGVSLQRVFFTESSSLGDVKYLTIDNEGKTDVAYFMETGDVLSIVSLELENGFFYYYEMQEDMSYNLCRKKFGSDKTVTLLKNVNTKDYVIINSNRLYYSSYKDSKFRMRELNMNSGSKKTLLSVSGVSDDNTLAFFHGGDYDFIIGEKSDGGEKVYRGSCVYTGSTNTMNFKDGKWKY